MQFNHVFENYRAVSRQKRMISVNSDRNIAPRTVSSYLLPHHFVFPAFLNLTKKNLYISNARSGLWNNKAYGNELAS